MCAAGVSAVLSGSMCLSTLRVCVWIQSTQHSLDSLQRGSRASAQTGKFLIPLDPGRQHSIAARRVSSTCLSHSKDTARSAVHAKGSWTGSLFLKRTEKPPLLPKNFSLKTSEVGREQVGGEKERSGFRRGELRETTLKSKP